MHGQSGKSIMVTMLGSLDSVLLTESSLRHATRQTNRSLDTAWQGRLRPDLIHFSDNRCLNSSIFATVGARF